MAGVTLDQLSPALGFNGNELFWIYQQGPTEATPWIGIHCTLSQIASWVGNPTLNTLGCSMRQLVAALANQDVLIEVFDALPSDITNAYNIAWTHGSVMNIADPFSVGFLQPTLGYTTLQMELLYALAITFPV